MRCAAPAFTDGVTKSFACRSHGMSREGGTFRFSGALTGSRCAPCRSGWDAGTSGRRSAMPTTRPAQTRPTRGLHEVRSQIRRTRSTSAICRLPVTCLRRRCSTKVNLGRRSASHADGLWGRRVPSGFARLLVGSARQALSAGSRGSSWKIWVRRELRRGEPGRPFADELMKATRRADVPPPAAREHRGTSRGTRVSEP